MKLRVIRFSELYLSLTTTACQPTWVVHAERSSSPGRQAANDDEREDRRLADGLHDAALPSVAMAAAAAAAAMATLFCSELRVPPR